MWNYALYKSLKSSHAFYMSPLNIVHGLDDSALPPRYIYSVSTRIYTRRMLMLYASSNTERWHMESHILNRQQSGINLYPSWHHQQPATVLCQTEIMADCKHRSVNPFAFAWCWNLYEFGFSWPSVHFCLQPVACDFIGPFCSVFLDCIALWSLISALFIV